MYACVCAMCVCDVCAQEDKPWEWGSSWGLLLPHWLPLDLQKTFLVFEGNEIGDLKQSSLKCNV
jgi:hypothetical protein